MYKFFPCLWYIYNNQTVFTCILLVNLIRGSRACIETGWYCPLSLNSLLITLITILSSMSVFLFFSRCTLLIRWTLYLQMFHYHWLLKNIDWRLIDRINVLKEAILYMRMQIQNIKTHLITSCHARYKWIHVGSLLFSSSEMPWDQIKAHLRGIWNSSQVDINMDI